MDKKLEKGILLIRKLAEKYKNAIMQTLKLKSRKTIDKKNKKKKKKIYLYIKNNNNKTYKEEKKRKLDNYLSNQEKELDFQENYSFFNKFRDKSYNIFYNTPNDNIVHSLKTKVSDKKSDNQIFKLVDDNFVNSLNSLHFEIKQKIQENNDLLSLKEFTERDNSSKVESKTKDDIKLKKESHTNKDLKTTIKKEKKIDEGQVDYTRKKNKKRKNNSEYTQYSNCENKFSNSSNIEPNENFESTHLKKKKSNLFENKYEKDNKKIVSNCSMSPNKVIDDILYKNNEMFTENKKSDLVFGKNKFENINEIFQKVFEGSKFDKNNENEVIKYNDQNKCEDNTSNKCNEENENICNNILNKTNETCANEYPKEKVSCKDNKTIFEKNHKNSNDNNHNLNYVQKDTAKDNLGCINYICDQNNSEETRKCYNILTPHKEDNSFDIFFNESLGTPSIFQM